MSKWWKEFGERGDIAFPGKRHQTPLEEEMRKLKRENEILRQERDILKKECLGSDIFPSRNEAKTAVFEYIEIYYVRSVQPKLAITSEGMAGREIIPDNS